MSATPSIAVDPTASSLLRPTPASAGSVDAPSIGLETRRSRFVFIDALRGIAAVSVVCHHLYNTSELQKPLFHILPRFFTTAFDFGARGVQVFFVISGFVIAYSLRNTSVTWRSAANFVLRRQVRLDPAYWVLLAVGTANLWLAAWAHGFAPEYGRPSLPDILASLLYLQNIFHRYPIVDVAWTLCLEIQFYVFFLCVLAFGQRLGRRRMIGATPVLLAITAVASIASHVLVHRISSRDPADSPWFIYTWYMFALGALAYWACERGIAAWLFLVPTAFAIGCGSAVGFDRMIVASGTASFIYVLGLAGLLRKWSLGKTIQYLGAISYSLYLVHVPVLIRVYRAGIRWTGLAPGPAVCWFILAGIASVGVAHVFYHLVEEPTRKLASRLKPIAEAAPPLPIPPKAFDD